MHERRRDERVQVDYSFSVSSSSASGINRKPCGRSLRLFRCCVLGIILPLACVFIPLHAKYISYHDYELPLAASDMKVLDKHISTAWCQKQTVIVNASEYHAYLIESKPFRSANSRPVSMLRHFMVNDDTKEYWGFYVLKGSKITIASCTGRFGANLLLIKGRQSLQYCAYVGQDSTEKDDSSEEAVLRRQMKSQGITPSGVIPTTSTPAPLTTQDGGNIIADKLTKFKRAIQSEIRHIYKSVTKIPESKGGQTRKGWYTDASFQPAPQIRNKRRILDPPPRSGTPNGIDSSEEGTEPFEEFSGEAEDPKLFAAKRQGLVSDGISQDQGSFNFTTDNDGSNSEEGSSFSSSEEALLKCDGVILYLPLIPDSTCMDPTEPNRNEISYTVKEDDYYYFIYSSDNEKYSSHISARFTIDRVVYDIPSSVVECANSSKCEFDLRFGSSEKVLLTLPVPESNVSSAWDEVYLVQSMCEPRVSMYLGFFLMAPILFMFFAFA